MPKCASLWFKFYRPLSQKSFRRSSAPMCPIPRPRRLTLRLPEGLTRTCWLRFVTCLWVQPCVPFNQSCSNWEKKLKPSCQTSATPCSSYRSMRGNQYPYSVPSTILKNSSSLICKKISFTGIRTSRKRISRKMLSARSVGMVITVTII